MKNELESPAEAYELILDAIITQKLAPSQKVSEYILAEMFDISRNMARSTIEQLITQQFLVSISPRVTRVAPLTLFAIKQNFTLRKMLEPTVFSMAAATADYRMLDKLHYDIKCTTPIKDDTTALQFLKANKRSNLYLVEQARYPLLINWVNTLEDTAMRIYWLYTKLTHTYPFSPDHQKRLVEALRKDDAREVHSQTLMILESCEERVMKAIFSHDQLNEQDLHVP
ncbi:conserved hypothetical protein [Hyphomonas neptunium ATCC 15444]|uniref:GntR C-terminal domain-containing protein n=2 Tax=Hyphomonas TaxID=85 RepID=Q0C1S8_HYPNA|nr:MULTISPECIES: GntR family transcriptional regulator [Hyphomonas]ABI76985.1 conserved hypothetical protein [Hyphomonas neptunium ATCC 15444]KCZ92599.1 hypothetical protein HHI_11486 [Hyphomonas hirschiana VP5]